MSRSDVLPDPNNVATATHIVRQPIYDANVKVDRLRADRPRRRRSRGRRCHRVGTVMQIGLNIVAGGLAWVPLSRGFLFGGHAEALPPDRVVFEVAPDLGTDPHALAAIRRLKKADYQLAIDPLTRCSARRRSRRRRSCCGMADAVKIDATQDRATLAEPGRARPPRRRAGRRQERRDARDVRDLQGARLRPVPGLLLLPAARGREPRHRGQQPQQAAPDRGAAGPGRRHATRSARSSRATSACRTTCCASSTRRSSRCRAGSSRSATRSCCSASRT